jgi:hypothetical protein
MKIHLHSREGLYSVKCYSPWEITVFTKKEEFTVPVSDFKSFAGGTWNSQVSKEDIYEFLTIVIVSNLYDDSDEDSDDD